MDNQHRYIAGYRELNKDEIYYVNRLKQIEGVLLERLDELQADVPEIDHRWLAIGKTHMEQAFMAVIRSITRPEPGGDSLEVPPRPTEWDIVDIPDRQAKPAKGPIGDNSDSAA